MISLLALVVIVVLIGGGIWAWPLVLGVLGISSATDKPGALRHIKQLMNTYDITPTEVEIAFRTPADTSAMRTRRGKGDIVKTLFIYLGAIFIFAGISIYTSMFWASMSSAMRVFVTLGVGYVLLIILISALREGKYPRLILPLTLACVFMMTGGWFVLINEVFPHGENLRHAMLAVFGMMALHYGVLFSKYRRTVLAFTALVFVYGFLSISLDLLGIPVSYIAIVLGVSLFLVGTVLEKTPHRALAEPAFFMGLLWLYSGLFIEIAAYTASNWANVIVGVCMMLAAYGFQKAERYPRLVVIGYFIGSLMGYIGLFDLVRGTSIELLYLAVAASSLYACVALQSRALLLNTVIAMLAFIGYYSAEHFANSLGWPITLVLTGVAFLGVGTIAIKVKRYI